MYQCKPFGIFFLFLTVLCILLPGCASSPQKAESSEYELYYTAQDYLQQGLFQQATKKLEEIESNYPFSHLGSQIQLNLIYVYYQGSRYPQAIAQTQKFIRLYPSHKNLDYVYYMQGLAYEKLQRDALVEFIVHDTFNRDPSEMKKAFESYQILLKINPESVYARDAQARMYYIHEQLAAHILAIAQFYQKRKAWVAVIKRCQEIIEHYPQSQALRAALIKMHSAYQQLGLTKEAQETQAVFDASFTFKNASNHKKDLLSTNQAAS